MLSDFGLGFAHSGERHYYRGPSAAFWSVLQPVPLCLYLHGATGNAHLNASDPYEMGVIRQLAKHFLVLVSDWGSTDPYGNDTAIARIDEGVTAARASSLLNIDDQPVVLCGLSMGVLNALNYALANPSKVRAVAGMIPGLDPNDIAVNNRGGLASALNAAYGGTYSEVTHGPTHNPVTFASTLPSDLPIRLWTSTNDTYAVPSTADAFVAARPQTVRTSLGAVGHSTSSIDGAQQSVADWCIQNA